MSLEFGLTGFLAVLAIVAFAISAIIWKIRWILLEPFRSSLLNIPGPPSTHRFLGSVGEIFESDGEGIHRVWLEKYGSNVMYRGWFNLPRLMTIDTRALNHILTHSADYQKPDQARRGLAEVLGQGILFVEGEQHRQQRRVLNPAFGPAQIRGLTDIFINKAIELRNLWTGQMSRQGGAAIRIDVLQELSKMTLDVIGLAGFNYDLGCLNPQGAPTELGKALKVVLDVPQKVPIVMILRNFFPALRFIPDRQSRRNEEANRTMCRIGSMLIADKKAAIIREQAERKALSLKEDENDASDNLRGRDLLTLLLKANMATDIPESQRLSDEDVLAQVPTFLLAGHETTSTATTWCLFALSRAPDVQMKLREELLRADTDMPTMDELNALPYLDMVVRETLRLYSPVSSTIRVAKKDDIIPLNEPFTDRHGEVQDSIRVNAGSFIIIPIAALHRMKSIWGDDADEFRPERWENPPAAISSVHGVWSHLLTFLGGPRACIGYRFSLVEMKALIFTLIRTFEFELAVPAEEIRRRSMVVQRPLLRSSPEQGAQLPLIVKPYIRA